MDELTNQGLFLGTLTDIDEVDVATTLVTTKLVNGLSAVKTANKDVWVNGELTYKVVITNNSGEEYTNLIFFDSLDVSKIALVENSVYVNESIAVYTYSAGLFQTNLGDLLDGETMTIVFKVVRI